MQIPIFKIAGTLGFLLISGLMTGPPSRAWGAAEESFTLPNGLKVIIVEQPGSQVVSMRVMIRTGAVDEAVRSEYGLAHLMEHMAFKGTSRFPDPGLISSLVERNGGDMNAYTSSDSTVYYLNMPSDQLTLGLEILSDLVFNPLYDPKEYELEKEVVIEEIKRGLDSPDRMLMESFFDAAYPDHPYGRPVIGSEETVKNVSVEEARDFFKRHYRPDNAVLVLTGGFDRQEAGVAVEKFFAPLANPDSPLPRMADPALPPPAGPVVRIIESEKVALAKVLIGFRGPAGKDADAPTMDLFSSVLSGGKSSRLIETIKDQKGLVTNIAAGSYTPRYQGSFIISMETEPGKVIPAITALWQELEKITAAPASDAELSRARALAEKDFLSGQESSLGLASQITDFETLFGDWRLRDAYLPLWNRTSPTELSVSAFNYLLPKNMTITVMLPKGNPDNKFITSEELTKLARQLAPNLSSSAAKTAPTFTEIRLDSGPLLVVMRDATLPLVTVKAAAMGGLLAEKDQQSGLNNFMTNVWTKATEQQSAPELARSFENIGASIGAASGRNSVGLSASFLASSREEGFRLFIEVLTSPAFSPEDVERVRPEILAQIKAQDEQLGGRVMRLLARNLYPGGHPYSRDLLGTAESVAIITPQDLRALYQGLIRPENLVIAVAGDIEPERIKELLDEALASWKPEGASLKIVAPPAPEAIAKAEKISETLNRAQTHIAYGFQAASLGDGDGPALDVLAAYLSGMSGPLFRELRDQQSLAYTVQAGYNPGLNVGSFAFYIASDPKKVDAALKGFNEIIDRVRHKPISDKELDGAKRYIIGTTKANLQTIGSRTEQAILNSLYNLGLDYDVKRLAAIEKVTAEDVRRVAEKYLQPDRGVMTILGQNGAN